LEAGQGAGELLCNATTGAKEVVSIKQDGKRELDFAVLLDE
jgi:hypothetical protein